MSNLSQKDLLYKTFFFLFLIYFFFIGIQLMGSAFKMFGKEFSHSLITETNNPFVGLMVGILATSVIQSSSCTTSIVVGLVASNSITIVNAVPIIMGANIGTTITNTLVSLCHIHRKDEFRRAFAGATCHDFFNLLSVIVILPLQIKFHLISKIASFLTGIFIRVGGIQIINPLKLVTGPVINFFRFVCFHNSFVILIFALIMLFSSLRFITQLMRGLAATSAEKKLNGYIFNNPIKAFLTGTSITAIIQSSSVATSFMIPLVGAGIVKVEKNFPYTLGTNIGTTITAILASLATTNPFAITIALCHLIFNILGICIFYPLRWIPIGLAKEFAKKVVVSKKYVIIYLLFTFYFIPLALLFLWR